MRLPLSVLFTIRTAKHSSMGYSPYKMLYNKDPIMPFQHADCLKYAGQSDDDDDVNEYDYDATEIYAPTDNHGLQSTIEHLENQHKQIFDKAHKSIKMLRYTKKRGITISKLKGSHLKLAHVYWKELWHNWGTRAQNCAGLSLGLTWL